MLTETAEDVLAALRPMLGQAFEETVGRETAAPPSTDAERAEGTRTLVEEKLGPAPVEIDELIRQCGVPAAEVLTVLLELELAGRVQRQPGNRIGWR
jgi:DNA processing protein